MTVLVTGATGHIGANLVRALVAKGRRVRVMVRQDTRAIDGLEVERVAADTLRPETLPAALDGIEVVYHLAGQISIVGDPKGEVFSTNVTGTRNVVEACLRAKVKRLIHFSSIHAFCHEPLDQPLDETRRQVSDRNCPAYDRSKAAGELEVQEGVKRGLSAVIVNPTSVVGPHDFKPSRMGEVVLDLSLRRLPALVGGGFDWVDVRDVADGAMAAEERGRTGERYLLGGKWASVRELAALVEEFSGRRSPRLVAPLWLAGIGAPFITAYSKITNRTPLYTREALHALRGHRNIRHDKAAGELGYRPRELRDTIRDTVAWFRDKSMY